MGLLVLALDQWLVNGFVVKLLSGLTEVVSQPKKLQPEIRFQ